MASLSIGDALAIAQSIYKLYKFFHEEAPKEVSKAIEAAKSTAVLLEAYNKPNKIIVWLQTPDGKKMNELINGKLKDLRATLLTLKGVLLQAKKARNNALKWTIFYAMHTSELRELQQDINGQNESIGQLFQTASYHNDANMWQKMEDMMNKLKAANVRSEKAKSAANRNDSTDPSVLDAKETGAKRVFRSAGLNKVKQGQLDANSRTKLVEELGTVGFTTTEATTMIDTYEHEASKQAAVKPPAVKIKKIAPKSSPGAEPGVSGQPVKIKTIAPPNARAPSPGLTTGAQAMQAAPTSGKGKPLVSILIVDGPHGSRAIMAHMYLELVRAWTANSGLPWLFHRVSSAGANVPSYFRQHDGSLDGDKIDAKLAGSPVNAQAIDSVFTYAADFASPGPIDEKGRITDRLKALKRAGLDEDFVEYTYILCFDAPMLQRLSKLWTIAKAMRPADLPPVKSSVVLLSDVPWDVTDLRVIAEPLRTVLKKFLREQLAWKRPAGSMAGGQYRTAFVPLRRRAQKELIIGDDRSQIKKMEAQTKTTMRVAYRAPSDHGWMVGITGHEEQVIKAVDMVKDLLADDYMNKKLL